MSARLRPGANLGYLAIAPRDRGALRLMNPTARFDFFYFYGFFRPTAERVERRA